MAISGNLNIKVGLPNESTNSDSLYTAFNKINTNFNTIFGNADKVTAGNGITITNNPSNTVISTNLVAGNGIDLQVANGAITIINTGGSGNGTAGINGVVPGAGILVNGSNAAVYSGNVTLSLANSNVTPAVYTNPTITIDSYGRIISAANSSVAGTVTSVAISPGSGISVAGGPITNAGIITVTNTGVTRLTAGSGITLTGNTGNILISAAGAGGGITSIDFNSQTGLTFSNNPIVAPAAGTISINLPTNLVIVGNITAQGRFVGNGSGLSNIVLANITGIGNISSYNLEEFQKKISKERNMACKSVMFPSIDFSQNTLLGNWTGGSCAAFGFKRTISKDSEKKEILYSIKVQERDIACRGRGLQSLNMVTIPKLPKGYKVTFEP